MKTDKVDVILPSYNCGKFIVDAINSILIQSIYVKKIIVVDDGSIDNTRQIVVSKAKSNKKIEYIYQPNKGLSAARNTGIKQSRARYLAFLDADDIWLPGKLESQIRKFETTKYNNLGLVYGEYLDIDEDGNPINNYGGFRLHHEIKGDVSKKLIECNYATGSGSAVLVKRECFDHVGMFDEALKACEDWDMWMRIAQEYSFDYVDAPLVKLRRHNRSMQANRWHMTSNQALLMNKMQNSNIIVSNSMFRELRRDLLGIIVSNPFNGEAYRLLKKITNDSNTYKSKSKEFIIDLVWASYATLPLIARIATNRNVRKYIIYPVKKSLTGLF